mmetsp:Transcript_20983/g.65010  ORF Transcript_20983/g.65010 Transcript_20983/m.65010 type:complete len:154 (-) Transcript_20983:1601-2062(-)
MTVDRRCATKRMVYSPEVRPSSEDCTSASDSASNADVASSSSSSLGRRKSSLAMAMRCFCPPESRTPRSPTRVSYPSGKSQIKLCAPAALQAASTCASVTSSPSSAPYLMLYAMDSAKTCVSWETTPMWRCRSRRLSSRRSRPSHVTRPAVGS